MALESVFSALKYLIAQFSVPYVVELGVMAQMDRDNSH